MRNGGTAIIYGAMSGLTMTVAIPDVLFRGVDIRGFWLSPWTKSCVWRPCRAASASTLA